MPLVTVNGTTYNLNTNGPRAWNHTGNDWAQAISAYVANIQSGFIDLVALGADPTGTTDATTIIQSAVATAISTGKAISGQGTFLITDTITIADCYGLRMLGSGAYGLKLKWASTAPSGRPMILVKNAQQIWLDQLGFIGNASAIHRPSAYIESRSDTTYTRTYVPTALRVMNCDLGNADNQATDGIVFSNTGGGSDTNNDFGFFLNVRCYFTTVRAQASIQHSQSVEHQFHNCFFLGGQYGVSNAITGNGGGFRWTGGGYGSHSVSDFQIAAQSAQTSCTILGGNSEGSNRFLIGPGINNNAQPIIVQGVRFATNALNADGYWILFQSAGPLTVEGCSLTDAVPARIQVNNGGSNNFSLVFRNNTFVMGNSLGDPIDVGTPTGGHWRVECTGNMGRTAGDVAQLIPSYVKSSDYTGPISVREYGATGLDNAGIDDSAAFTSALTLAALTGREIIVPAGFYRLNVTLPTDSNYSITIRGEGSNATGVKGTVLRPYTAGTDVIAQTDTTFCNPTYTIKDLTILGPDPSSGTTSGHALKIAGTHSVPIVTLRNITVRDFRGSGKAGIYLTNTENSILDTVHVAHSNIGFDFGQGVGAFNGNSLINCIAETCVYGMKVDGSSSVSVQGLVVQSNEKSGLWMTEGIGWTFSGCHFENNNTTNTVGDSAVKLQGATGKSIQHIVFTGTNFFGVGTANDTIHIDGVAGYTATGVKFIGGYSNGMATPKVTLGTYATQTLIDEFCDPVDVSDSAANQDTRIVFRGKLYRTAGNSSASPGNATLNNFLGKSAIAAGASAATITSDKCTSASQVRITPLDLDTTLTSYKAIPGSGSFVITGNANATAAWKFAWELVN